jgi:hypothetical protein
MARRKTTVPTDPKSNFTAKGSVKPDFSVAGSFSEVPKRSVASRLGSSGGGRYSTSKSVGTIKAMLNNIDDGVTPWQQEGDCIGVTDTIVLCQKAYWNVAIFRLSIDVMTEFANSPIHFKSANKQSVKFYEKWWKEVVGGWKVSDQFFREWFRSGNIFVYRFDGEIPIIDFKRLKTSKAAEALQKKIPIRYVLLNPADIRCNNSAAFVNAEYSKLLNPYELERLKKPTTDEEIRFKESLDMETRKAIDKGNVATMKLKQEQLTAVFCKKQDYEPMAVPMYFPVLFDINLKLQFKKMESAISRTADFMVLLITMGEKPDEKGGGGTDPELLSAMRELYQTESIGRVMVADYTTKMEFVIPKLNEILGSEKYKIVNQDIADGLMNIFFSENKFADSMVKIKMFLERLNESRKAFIEFFLMPEMKRIGKELGFRDIPVVEFETVDLKNEVEYMKIYSRMAELGLLTPEETFDALKTNQLPTSEDSIISQEEFKKLKKRGLYEPLLGGPKDPAAAAGRPKGAKAPQKKKNIQPAGASAQFSTNKIAETIKKSQELVELTAQKFKEKNNYQRLSKKHKETAASIAHLIIKNERMEDWGGKVDSYLAGQFDPNFEIVDAIEEMSSEHIISDLLASILFHSTQLN